MLSLGLNTALVASESARQHHGADSVEHASTRVSHTTLSLFDARSNQPVVESESSAPLDTELQTHRQVDPANIGAEPGTTAAQINMILRQHYTPASNDPDYIDRDLDEMARYFSRYPQAVELLTALKGQSWQLAYASNTFETKVRGSQIQVKSVKVYFDSRAAALLRSHRACAAAEKRGACVASPADALLHELLHAKSALLESRQFIEQGGMNSVMYPFAHENDVIKRENALYKSMTAIDGSYRPNRHSHSGRVVASACVTCVN